MSLAAALPAFIAVCVWGGGLAKAGLNPDVFLGQQMLCLRCDHRSRSLFPDSSTAADADAIRSD